MATESIDDIKKKYLDEEGLMELASIIKPMLLSTAQKKYLDDKIANVTSTLSANYTAVEYGKSTAVVFTLQTLSAGDNHDAISTPSGYTRTAIGLYKKSKTLSDTYTETVTANLAVGSSSYKTTASMTVKAYSKIKYISTTAESIWDSNNNISVSGLSELSLRSNSKNTTINFSAPSNSNNYYAYILVPVGTASDTKGAVELAPGISANTAGGTAALPGGAVIAFDSSAPQYVYGTVGSAKIKYKLLKTEQLSKSMYNTIQITLV